jgi:hypothetical protein
MDNANTLTKGKRNIVIRTLRIFRASNEYSF